MASKQNPSEQTVDSLDVIQANHDEAFLYISQGLSYQEQKRGDMAIKMYNRGLTKINAALEVRCDRSHCVGPRWDCSRKMQQKMRKTQQMVKEQLAAISKSGTEDVSPPSYDEACGGQAFLNDRRASCPSSSFKFKNQSKNENLKTMVGGFLKSKNQAIDSSVSEVKEIFAISDGVQLFYISADNTVTASLRSCALHVYMFVDNRQQAASAETMLPTGWLQVGNLTYPLVPGQSPALESGYGAFLFPDINNERDGTVAAVIFPGDIDMETRKTFKSILDEMTMLQAEFNKSLTSAPESFSDSLSRGIVTGAEYLAAGLSKGAAFTGEYMHKGALMLKERLQPEIRPYEVDPKLQQCLKVAKIASTSAVAVTGYLASKLGQFTMAAGTALAPHIRTQGTRLLTSAFGTDEEKTGDAIDGVLTVAAGGFQGFSTVYFGLQNAATMLAIGLSNDTVDIVDYKYGRVAGEAVGDAVSAVGNLALATHNVKSFGVKSIAKRTAKDAGKAVLEDYLNQNQEQNLAAQSSSNKTEQTKSSHAK